MQFQIILSAVLAISAAVPQRKAADQQSAAQNYNNYQSQPDYSPTEIRQPIQDFRPKVELETTSFVPIIRFDKEQGTDGSYKTS